MTCKQQKLSAFTLIELSIVLVIIGLIVGGVLVGRDLISAAAARAQISQIEKYQQAVNTFRGKYGYLPGDLKEPEATQFGFLPRAGGEGLGNGNWLVVTFNDGPGNLFAGEYLAFWVDLSAARLIDGGFSAVTNPTFAPGSTVTGASIGRYVPAAKIETNYVYVWAGGWLAYSADDIFAGDGRNYFGISDITTVSAGGDTSTRPSMSVSKAYSIDKKVDDGHPQNGRVTATYGGGRWAAGGGYNGDQDNFTNGPIGSSTNDYTTAAGGTLAQTCYNDLDASSAHTLSEHYSLEVNNGTGPNCALSFRLQ